jgi:CubicO group peptidase (beta-lactamase class C family)
MEQGASLSLILLDPSLANSEGYGTATFPSSPVTPSTLFYTSSTTKAFTAAIMSFLVDEQRKVSYHSMGHANPLLIHDDFVLENDYTTNHITIEDALSHRSGLPGHDRSYGGSNTTIKDIVRSLCHLPLTTEPRTKYQYCNMMFMTASHVIETVTGRKLGDLMREWIWEPLGMDATFLVSRVRSMQRRN